MGTLFQGWNGLNFREDFQATTYSSLPSPLSTVIASEWTPIFTEPLSGTDGITIESVGVAVPPPYLNLSVTSGSVGIGRNGFSRNHFFKTYIAKLTHVLGNTSKISFNIKEFNHVLNSATYLGSDYGSPFFFRFSLSPKAVNAECSMDMVFLDVPQTTIVLDSDTGINFDIGDEVVAKIVIDYDAFYFYLQNITDVETTLTQIASANIEYFYNLESIPGIEIIVTDGTYKVSWVECHDTHLQWFNALPDGWITDTGGVSGIASSGYLELDVNTSVPDSTGGYVTIITTDAAVLWDTFSSYGGDSYMASIASTDLLLTPAASASVEANAPWITLLNSSKKYLAPYDKTFLSFSASKDITWTLEEGGSGYGTGTFITSGNYQIPDTEYLRVDFEDLNYITSGDVGTWGTNKDLYLYGIDSNSTPLASGHGLSNIKNYPLFKEFSNFQIPIHKYDTGILNRQFPFGLYSTYNSPNVVADSGREGFEGIDFESNQGTLIKFSPKQRYVGLNFWVINPSTNTDVASGLNISFQGPNYELYKIEIRSDQIINTGITLNTPSDIYFKIKVEIDLVLSLAWIEMGETDLGRVVITNASPVEASLCINQIAIYMDSSTDLYSIDLLEIYTADWLEQFNAPPGNYPSTGGGNEYDYKYNPNGVRLVLSDKSLNPELFYIGETSTTGDVPVSGYLSIRHPSASLFWSSGAIEGGYTELDTWFPLNDYKLNFYSEDVINTSDTNRLVTSPYIWEEVRGENFTSGMTLLNTVSSAWGSTPETSGEIYLNNPNLVTIPAYNFDTQGNHYLSLENSNREFFNLTSTSGEILLLNEAFSGYVDGDLWGQGTWTGLTSALFSPIVSGGLVRIEKTGGTEYQSAVIYNPLYATKIKMEVDLEIPSGFVGEWVIGYSDKTLFASDEINYSCAFRVYTDGTSGWIIPLTATSITSSETVEITTDESHKISLVFNYLTLKFESGQVDDIDILEWAGLISYVPAIKKPDYFIMEVVDIVDTTDVGAYINISSIKIYEIINVVAKSIVPSFEIDEDFESFEYGDGTELNMIWGKYGAIIAGDPPSPPFYASNKASTKGLNSAELLLGGNVLAAGANVESTLGVMFTHELPPNWNYLTKNIIHFEIDFKYYTPPVYVGGYEEHIMRFAFLDIDFYGTPTKFHPLVTLAEFGDSTNRFCEVVLAWPLYDYSSWNPNIIYLDIPNEVMTYKQWHTLIFEYSTRGDYAFIKIDDYEMRVGREFNPIIPLPNTSYPNALSIYHLFDNNAGVPIIISYDQYVYFDRLKIKNYNQ